MPYLLLFALLLLALALVLYRYRRKLNRRKAALTRLLDLADAVESLLNRSQARMTALQSLVTRVPTDIGAIAQASLENSLPIRDAKRDVLQHRLWIQKNGASAALAELDAACAALDRVHQRLSRELDDLEKAGTELANATQAAIGAAQREPPTLRRYPET